MQEHVSKDRRLERGPERLSGRSRSRLGRLIGVVVAAALAAALPRVALAGELEGFERPAGLEERIEFWKQIFAVYSDAHVVIHDREHLGRIYSILDFSREAQRMSSDQLRRYMRQAETREIERIRGLLIGLHRDPSPARLTVEEMRIRSLLIDDPHPDRYRRAADAKRLRAQRGIRDRFLEGVRISARYMPRMEEIFRDEGVPVGLTRLPLIESSFNTFAYSKVGAAGMWQFVPGTGKLYLKITGAVDERLDPFVATRAAARFLRENYERLGTWPLAITAYNHGPAGMARAVRSVGTRDIVTIIDRYQSPTFGFASKNFYAEFLAALEIHRNYRNYFGDIDLHPEWVVDEIPLRHYVAMASVEKCVGNAGPDLRDLNPAVRPAAYRGRSWLPPGYAVRLPGGSAPAFQSCYDTLPSSAKRTSHPVMVRYHTVRRGETLSRIAARYGVGVSTLRRTNNLRSANHIRIGQRLKIPTSAPVSTSVARSSSRPPSTSVTRSPSRSAAPVATTHWVRSGETLGRIAGRYGVSIASLRQANNLRSANHIWVGQRLKIPGSGAAVASRKSSAASTSVHRVRSGETLGGIAGQYGVSVTSLRRSNNLSSANHIIVGQKLTVPSSGASARSTATVTHKVRSGETLASIARRYGQSVDSIRRANGLRNANQIQAGQRLRIPGG